MINSLEEFLRKYPKADVVPLTFVKEWMRKADEENRRLYLRLTPPQWVDPEPNRCTHWILDTDRCALRKGHSGLHAPVIEK